MTMFNRLNPQDILKIFYKIMPPSYDYGKNDKPHRILCDVKQPEKWIQILIDCNFINTQLPLFGDTVLMWACTKGRDDLVKMILAANADLDLRNLNDETALSIALKELQPECVSL